MILDNTKVSPAFDPFLSRSGPDDRRDAIVIYRTPVPADEADLPPNLRELQRRLQYVKSQATAQRAVQAQVSTAYHKVSTKLLPRKDKRELTVESIGGSVLPVAAVEVTRRTLAELAQQDNVIAVLPNQRIRLIRPKEVSYDELVMEEDKDGMTWGLKHLGIPKMWETSRGKGVKVAVLDTGVHGAHPALDGRVKDFVAVDPLGRRLTLTNGDTFDGDQHGTHVCGTIAGGKADDRIAIGVAPEADLLAAAVLVGNATLRTLIEGIAWAVERGADIINMSLGFNYYEPLFDRVFELLINQFGVLPVVAIGNENYGNSSSPGNAARALSVGAVEKNAAGAGPTVAAFSSGASLVFPGAAANQLVTKPDVVAPGVQVFSAIPPEERPDGTHFYTWMGGTSMATPHVAGVAALLMAASPNAPVTDIADVLKQTAQHPDGVPGRQDNRWGFGMIRPAEALKALGVSPAAASGATSSRGTKNPGAARGGSRSTKRKRAKRRSRT